MWTETTMRVQAERIEALEAERDALRLRVAELEAAAVAPLAEWEDAEGWHGMVDESADGSANVRIILWDGTVNNPTVHVVPAKQALGIAAALAGFARAAL